MPSLCGASSTDQSRRLQRRRLVLTDVIAHPTAGWSARQITEAFPLDEDAPLRRPTQTIGRIASFGSLGVPRNQYVEPHYGERIYSQFGEKLNEGNVASAGGADDTTWRCTDDGGEIRFEREKGAFSRKLR
jgi:hypothetical protein